MFKLVSAKAPIVIMQIQPDEFRITLLGIATGKNEPPVTKNYALPTHKSLWSIVCLLAVKQQHTMRIIRNY